MLTKKLGWCEAFLKLGQINLISVWVIKVERFCFSWIMLHHIQIFGFVVWDWSSCQPFSPKHWNTGLVSSGFSITSWRGASLALVGYPSSYGIPIKITYGVDVVFFPTGLVKTKSDFIVRSYETCLGRWTLVVAVINVDTYPSLAFSGLTSHPEDTAIAVFWLHCSTLERLLH